MTDTADPLVTTELVTLHYRELLPANVVRFGDSLVAGKFLGGRCPACQRLYVPNRGFCSLCVVPIGPGDELEVGDRGVVASFTIIAPVKYYGQTKTEPFIFASILLDGTSSPLRGQDVTGLPHEQVRAGLRVRAVWKPPAERDFEGLNARGGASSIEGAVTSFEPTGDPDSDRDSYRGFEF
ncbi:MAG: Zn-ribbon domain-containing OB-fold protein [Actinomycetes bacterium]